MESRGVAFLVNEIEWNLSFSPFRDRNFFLSFYVEELLRSFLFDLEYELLKEILPFVLLPRRMKGKLPFLPLRLTLLPVPETSPLSDGSYFLPLLLVLPLQGTGIILDSWLSSFLLDKKEEKKKKIKSFHTTTLPLSSTGSG